ncbi:hypothetical protein AB0P37_34380 [Streptomyces antimycoticus]|uniref:hypothetical protein n=1 Tax=Streptomyces antimycoticus TaxID=68175 RepID=UPI0034480C8B
MALPEQVAMPAQDRVGADQEQKVPESVFGEVVEQAGEDGAVYVGVSAVNSALALIL